MNQIYFLLIATIFTTSVFAKTVSPEPLKNISEKIKMIEVARERMNVEDGKIGIENKNILGSVKNIADQTSTYQNLKLALASEQKLDSLVIERWNETTGQLEISQLERWTWNVKEQGDTWELYDWNTTTGQWVPNDKEHYEWDENGNKIVHMDYDYDSITRAWFMTAKNDWEFDENGNEIYYDGQNWDEGNNEWTIFFKTITTYDENGSYLKIGQRIDPISNKMQNESKEEIIYDKNGNAITAALYEWDNSQDTWISIIQNKFTYDNNGNRIEEEFAMDSYFIHFKYENSYDSIGNHIQTITSQWDFVFNQYYYSKKDDYSYINDSLRSSSTKSEWNDSTLVWDVTSEYNYSYDATGTLQYFEYSKWDTTSDTLVLSSRNDRTFNALGKITSNTETLWDTINSEWLNSSKYDNEYNYIGNKIFHTEYTWDSIANQWQCQLEEHHNYDEAGNLLQHNYLSKDSITNKLAEEWSYDFTYDLSVRFSDLVYPPEYEYWHISNLKRFLQYSNVMLQKSYSKIKDNQLVATEVFSFHCSTKENTTSAVDLNTSSEQRVYPNPASDYVVFDIDNNLRTTTVELYTLQGNKISVQQLPNNKQLSVSQLKPGMYIYKIIQESKIRSGKIRVK